MDREDRRRYFVVGSVIVEIVQPILRSKLQNEYSIRGFATLQDFLSSQPVLHILYHLRHKKTNCCTDSANCTNYGLLPLNYYQWDLMYAENPGPGIHHCHCKYSARSVHLNDLDITLSSLILMNCFRLSNNDIRSIENLRTLKNNYLSHNTKGAIKEQEYRTIWADLTMYVLQLDNTKQDYLTRIELRPLDPALCHKYNAELLGMHQKLDEIGSSINGLEDTMNNVDANVGEIKTDIGEINRDNGEIKMDVGEIKMDVGEVKMDVKGLVMGVNYLQTLLQKPEQRSVGTEVDTSCLTTTDKTDHYRLGQDIFTLHHQVVMSVLTNHSISDMVMMDDGRLVMCDPWQNRLLISDTEGGLVDSIDVQGRPCYVTAVNSHTVAVLNWFQCIEMYDINTNVRLKSFTVPEMCTSIDRSITTITNKLVVSSDDKLLIIDLQTEQVVQTIHTDCHPWRVHAACDRIYFCDIYRNNINLYCYSATRDRLFTTTLPSKPNRITSLRDSSLYVVCEDGSILHMSSDGRKFKTVKTKGLRQNISLISYNLKQKKLCFLTKQKTLNVYYEK